MVATFVYLIDVHFMDIHLMGVHFIDMHFVGVHLMGVYLMGVHFMGVPRILWDGLCFLMPRASVFCRDPTGTQILAVKGT